MTRRRGIRPLLVTATVFSRDWLDPALYALKTSIRVAWPDAYKPIFTMISSGDRRPHDRGAVFHLDALPKALEEQSPSLCVFTANAEPPPEILRVASDAFVEITDPSRDAHEFALGISGEPHRLPDATTGSTYTPVEIDFAIGRGRTPVERLELLQKLRGMRVETETDEREQAPEAKAGPRIEDIHGYGVAGDWARQLVADLAAYRKGEIGWEDVDACALFVGPPGKGKTLLAQSLANSADVHFISTSYAQWQAPLNGPASPDTPAMAQRPTMH